MIIRDYIAVNMRFDYFKYNHTILHLVLFFVKGKVSFYAPIILIIHLPTYLLKPSIFVQYTAP